MAESKEALRLYQDAQKAAIDISQRQTRLNELAENEKKLLWETQTKFSNQSSQLSSMSRQLKKLATNSSREDQVKLFSEYVKVIGEELEKIQNSQEDIAGQ